MSQPMNMMGGPMPNIGTPNNAPVPDVSGKKLHTYIYDYFLKNGNHDVARAILKSVDLDLKSSTKQSPGSKNVNGINDSMDTDSKDDKRPDDLPLPEVPAVPGNPDNSFLFDWWHQFWECYNAQHGRNTNAQTAKYLNSVQARMTNERNRLMRVDPQMQANMGMRPGMMPAGMQTPAEMAKKMGLPPGRQPTAQQMHQMQNVMRMQQIQMQQSAMQREGSANDQRPTSPGAGGENAPSPKRQRLDGSFNGGMPMGPMGRGQPQGMPGQPMGNPQAKMQQQVYAQAMRQQVQSAMDSDVNKGLMAANGVPMPQDANPELFNRPGGMPGQGPQNANSNHALQDYQMQLMLLEQQNKKRLLMARQEQDNMTNGPNGPVPGPGGPGQPQPQNPPFAPAMSPSNSRAGPSPGPNEQMRRGTPKMAPGVVPSPTADGGMPGRASPAPGQFDPSMNPAMFPMGMMKGPNGQPMMQPPSSHPPGFAQLPPQQQMEIFRQQQARNGVAQMANGFMPQPGPNMMGPQPPQQPNMTPHQRNAAMPPPPAPGDGPRGGTQPSSPSQNQAPPTPSQANKANAKAKKDGKASAKGNKKAAGATPADSEQPPTPTPAPPITPQPSQAFPPKPGQPPNQQQPPQQNGQSNMPGQQNPGGDMGGMGAPFGSMNDDSFNMGLDFEMNGPDVLENFDFDSFLTNDAGADGFSFDPSGMNFGTDGGLEAGGDV